MPNVKKKEEKKTTLLLPTVIWCHPEPFSPLSLSIWSLSLLCICRVGSRRLPRRSWSQWPVSNLKAVSQRNTDNISCIVLINGRLTDCIPDIFQKLSATQDQRVWVIESGAHRVSDKLWRGYLWLCCLLSLFWHVWVKPERVSIRHSKNSGWKSAGSGGKSIKSF